MRLSLLVFFVFNLSISQNESIFLHKQFIDGNDTLNYQIINSQKNSKRRVNIHYTCFYMVLVREEMIINNN